MNQLSITFDAPAKLGAKIKSLAVTLGMTRVRNGEEKANKSIVVRMLLEMALSDFKAIEAAEFFKWRNESREEETRLERFTVQASDEFVAELETCARACNIVRRDGGHAVPNLTQVVVVLLRYALDHPERLVEWFRLCVEEGLK